MKITKSTFLEQNSGRTWKEQANFSGNGPPQFFPTRGNPVILMAEIKKQLDFEYLTLFL